MSEYDTAGNLINRGFEHCYFCDVGTAGNHENHCPLHVKKEINYIFLDSSGVWR